METYVTTRTEILQDVGRYIFTVNGGTLTEDQDIDNDPYYPVYRGMVWGTLGLVEKSGSEYIDFDDFTYMMEGMDGDGVVLKDVHEYVSTVTFGLELIV